jgi:predicted enzyme related to lactoylglutathione lyase
VDRAAVFEIRSVAGAGAGLCGLAVTLVSIGGASGPGSDGCGYEPGEADYTMISSGGQSHGAFSKAMERAPPPHWLSHVRVENLDETIEKAKSAGGKLAAGPFEMGEVGRIAIIADPQGAYISAYEPEGEGPAPRASSSGTSSGRPTSTARSASTATSSAGRPPTWAPSTAATGPSTAARRASRD